MQKKETSTYIDELEVYNSANEEEFPRCILRKSKAMFMVG